MLGPQKLNQALIRPVHMVPTANDIFTKVTNAEYLTVKNASLGYHNLKHDNKSSYLTTFACQFGRYRLTRLPFGVAPAGDMFQQKMDKIFKDLPNVFGVADDIVILGYDADDRPP